MRQAAQSVRLIGTTATTRCAARCQRPLSSTLLHSPRGIGVPENLLHRAERRAEAFQFRCTEASAGHETTTPRPASPSTERRRRPALGPSPPISLVLRHRDPGLGVLSRLRSRFQERPERGRTRHRPGLATFPRGLDAMGERAPDPDQARPEVHVPPAKRPNLTRPQPCVGRERERHGDSTITESK